MLGGVVASSVLKCIDVTDPRALAIIITGYMYQGNFLSSKNAASLTKCYTFQGLGFWITLAYFGVGVLRYVPIVRLWLSQTKYSPNILRI
jgi:hypothetical protein